MLCRYNKCKNVATYTVSLTMDSVHTEQLPLCDDCLDAVRDYVRFRNGDPDDDRILDAIPCQTL
jgi:hypothetical protein